jgi:flavin-dependent thymidylate synthase
MKVTLLTATPDALDVLLFTKNTRLRMTGGGLAEVKAWPQEKKLSELLYMRNTIQSSWEFVDYVFAIEGVTRAFTHQLVRHRVGTSFAQQAQRVVNMEGFEYLATGDLLCEDATSETRNTREYLGTIDGADHPGYVYDAAMIEINRKYGELVSMGVKSQDARGILPTNVLTNIVFKANLRTLHDMALKRLCVKAQGEFQDVFRALVDTVVAEHPWADDFLRVQCAWNGTCLFPSLPVEECHVKAHVFDPAHAVSYGEHAGMHPLDSGLMTTDQIYQLHRMKRTEIQPTVRA